LTSVHRHQAGTGIEYTKAKDVMIKSYKRVEIVCVESGLQDAGDSGHRSLASIAWQAATGILLRGAG